MWRFHILSVVILAADIQEGDITIQIMQDVKPVVSSNVQFQNQLLQSLLGDPASNSTSVAS